MIVETLTPAALAYTFSFANVGELIGWERDALSQPTTAGDEWLAAGAASLHARSYLVPVGEDGFTFSDGFSGIAMALIDPAVVLIAERKDDDGARRMTVHISDKFCVGLVRLANGHFEVRQYVDATAAAAACAAYLGAGTAPVEDPVRTDVRKEFLAKLYEYTQAGKAKTAAKALTTLDFEAVHAVSAVKALAEPRAKGMLTMCYCGGGQVLDGEVYSVFTSQAADTWVIFPPASIDGPMTLERSSVSALAARVHVTMLAELIKATAE